MAKLVTLQFRFEDDELEEFMEENNIRKGDLYEWAFGEMSQNLDFGFLVTCRTEDVE
jgi:hypothetical protein